jgi:prolyl oligopeptidase
MLIETGDHDDRVVPLHSFKYAAELQYKAGNGKVSGQRPLFLNVKKDQGHSGGGNREIGMKDGATSIAFMALVTGAQWQD